MDIKCIGMRIREKRRELNMTQEELSALSQISPAYISRIETGDQNLTVETLQRVASSLDMDIHYLLSGVQCDSKYCVKNIAKLSSPKLAFYMEEVINELLNGGLMCAKSRD